VVDMVTYEEGDEEERRHDRGVEKIEKRDLRSAGAKPETNGHSHSHLTTVNGNGNGAVDGGSVDKTKKLDLEIPRKALHASIGTSGLSASAVLVVCPYLYDFSERYTDCPTRLLYALPVRFRERRAKDHSGPLDSPSHHRAGRHATFPFTTFRTDI
jgi:hypothetical protein